ncbi:MAG: hypothetical protein JNM62_03095 [Flavobacteriales bacterium]|nr:hypothetical protein [Flavobacteriales bacterium]
MRAFLFPLLSLAAISQLKAQLPLVDIGMAQLEDGRLEVRLRADDDFSGIFSALVFTVRYPEASAATLVDFTPIGGNQFSGIYPDLSGNVQYSGGYAYATYAGFGFATTNPAWTAGQEMVLGHFAVNGGPGAFVLIEDTWTAAHNGDYYVSLNGTESTGIIYGITTSIPVHDATTELSFVHDQVGGMGFLTIEHEHGGRIFWELLDATGRVVGTWSGATSAGRMQLPVRAPLTASGIYRLRVGLNDHVRTFSWFIAARL